MNSSYNTYYEISDTVGLLSSFNIAYIILIIISVFVYVTMWKIFKKAGHEGWKSLIPIYNMYIMCQIAGKEWWYLLFFLVPFANIYAMFVIYDGVAKSFGKTTGFTFGMIFLPVIFFPILAFSKNSNYMHNNDSVNNEEETLSINQVSNDAETLSMNQVNDEVDDSFKMEDTFLYDAPVFGENDIKMNSFQQANDMNNFIQTKNDNIQNNLNEINDFNQYVNSENVPENNLDMNNIDNNINQNNM